MNLGYSRLDDAAINLGTSDVHSGTSDVATNAWSVDQQSGKVSVNFFGDLRLNNNSLTDVKSILGMWGKWSIDENGFVKAATVEADEIFAKKVLEVGEETVPTGIVLYDTATKEPYCVTITSGEFMKTKGRCSSASLTASEQVTAIGSVEGNQNDPSMNSTGSETNNSNSSLAEATTTPDMAAATTTPEMTVTSTTVSFEDTATTTATSTISF